MKKIMLTKGYHTIVDDEDYEALNKHKWWAEVGRATVYAVRQVPTPTNRIYTVKMHRQLLDAPKGMNVDHKNGNGLDNRKCNLRLCTDQQNNWNARIRKDNKSGLKGVSWHKNSKKWRTQIRWNDKKVTLGYFTDKLEAKKAYDLKAKQLFGEFACLG